MNMFSKVFGTRSQREVKRIMPLVRKIICKDIIGKGADVGPIDCLDVEILQYP